MLILLTDAQIMTLKFSNGANVSLCITQSDDVIATGSVK